MRGTRTRVGRRFISAGVALALTMTLAVATTAGAATVANAWKAKIGSSGANGTATLQVYATGSGALVLKVAKLKPLTSVPVVLSKGTCGTVGSTLVKLPALKTTKTGAAGRTSSLTAAQTTLVKSATAGNGKVAIRVGSVKTGGIKCGAFAVLPVPPTVTARTTVGFYPTDVVVTPTAVWVANSVDNSLSKIDPATNSVISEVTLGEIGAGFPMALAAGDGALWVSVFKYDATTSTQLPGSLLRVDPLSGQVTATISIGSNALDITASPGAVWAANYDDGTVSRIDTATNTVAATIALAKGVSAVAFGQGGLWVSNERTGSVTRVDPATNQVVVTIPTVGGPAGIAVSPGAVWVANEGHLGLSDGVLSRIDPATNQVVATTPVGKGPLFIAVGGGSVWVALTGESSVVQVNASTGAVRGRVAVVGPSLGIAATDHAAWAVQPNEAGLSTTPEQPGTLTRINSGS